MGALRFETLAIIKCMLGAQVSWSKSWLYYPSCFYMFSMVFGHVGEIPHGNLGGLDVPGPI